MLRQRYLLDRRSYKFVIIDCIACMTAFVFMAVYIASYFASIDIVVIFFNVFLTKHIPFSIVYSQL